MRILIVLTYYRPHISGLTIYAERLAKALSDRGHEITVLTSQYDKSLPLEEVKDGVRVVRCPVLLRVSKGVLMPDFLSRASSLISESDVVHLHLPQFEAAGIALLGRLKGKPTVITYHCDLRMPPGILSFSANFGVKVMNNLAAMLTNNIVTYTSDYAEHSHFLRRYLNKLQIIPPPVDLPTVMVEEIQQFSHTYNPQNRKPVIGFAARFATEKGVEILLEAMPKIIEKFPNLLVQFAGPYMNIVGEEHYFQRLQPKITQYLESGHWCFVGTLNPGQMAMFYPNLDVLVLPSLNSTEAFGLVQIEAMINKVPCVASDLPGVRQPVLTHGRGAIAPIGDADGLANAIIEVLSSPLQSKTDPNEIQLRYLPETIAKEYEHLFLHISKRTY